MCGGFALRRSIAAVTTMLRDIRESVRGST